MTIVITCVLSCFSCVWHFGVGCHGLLQGIFQTQGSNQHLLHPALAGRFFTTSASWEDPNHFPLHFNLFFHFWKHTLSHFSSFFLVKVEYYTFYLAPCFFHLAVCHGIYSTVVHRKHFFFHSRIILHCMNLSRCKWKTAPRDLEPVTRRIELSLSVMGKTAKGTGFGGSIKSLFEEAFCLRCLLDIQGELLVDSFGQMSLKFKVDKEAMVASEQSKEEAGGNVNLFSLTYFCQPVFCSGL